MCHHTPNANYRRRFGGIPSIIGVESNNSSSIIITTTGLYVGASKGKHDDVIKWKFFRVTAFCTRNSPVSGEFPAQRPVTRRFDVLYALRLNRRLDKQSRRRSSETSSRSR